MGFKVKAKTVTLLLKHSLTQAVVDAEAEAVTDAEARAKGDEEARTESEGIKSIEDAKLLLEDYAGVRITGLKKIPWNVTCEMIKASEEGSADNASLNIERAEFLLRKWLREWNLEDEADKPIPIDEFGDLPMDLIMAMCTAVSRFTQGENELPKGS